MDHFIRIDTTVPDSRKIQIQLPTEFPVGNVEVTVKVSPKMELRSSGKDILSSEIFGMWADRDDLGDSVEYARKLRDQAWKRPA